MDYTTLKTKEFIDRYLHDEPRDEERIVSNAREYLYDIYEDLDKIKFISAILENANAQLDDHRPKCQSSDECEVEKACTVIFHKLNRELENLGVRMPKDAFTAEDKRSTESKLDQILFELDEVKLRQEAGYDIILEEIEGLRSLFFLGKKNWKQIFAGKVSEMIISGAVSETLSKKLVVYVGKFFNEIPKLLP